MKQVAGQKQIHGIAYARDLDRIFVGNGVGVCSALDGRDYTVLKSIPVNDANSVRYDTRTNHVFVAADKCLAVIDAKTLDLLTTIKLPGLPYGFQVAIEKPRVYVNTELPCQVAVVDSEQNEVVHAIVLQTLSNSTARLAAEHDAFAADLPGNHHRHRRRDCA